MISNYEIDVPEYIVNLLYAEEDCARSFQINRNMKNKIKYRIIQEAVGKVFNSWFGFSRKRDTIKIVEDYIRKLIPKAERHRLSCRVGIVPDAQIKYEATQSAVMILLDAYNLMVDDYNDIVLF